jgi:hypothetical protein
MAGRPTSLSYQATTIPNQTLPTGKLSQHAFMINIGKCL